jgi:protein-disulfide isomerase
VRHVLKISTLGLSWLALPALLLVLAAPPARAELDAKALLADRVLGAESAPVTIYDYSSLTCPHCATFNNETLPLLKEKYIDTGKVKLVFRDFPLDRAALQAALIARCAKPARYYGFIDVLFKSQGQWGRASDPAKALSQIAKLGGMGQEEIDACLADKALMDGMLEAAVAAQKAAKIQSTPTFVFNDGAERIEGALPLDKFEAVIERLLGH